MHTSTLRDYLEERIDLRTGKMVLDYTDFEWGGELMPVSIHHVYNSALADVFYSRDADDRIADFSGMKLGYGWRLNLMQSMVPASVTHEGEIYSGYVYVDGDGNTTEFISKDNDGKYKPVAGEGVYEPSSGVLTLGGYAYTFVNSRLTKIARTDTRDPVEQCINYVNGRIDSVTDGAGRIFEFNYANGFLTSIVAPDNTAIVYSYSGNYLADISFNSDAQSEDSIIKTRVVFINDSESHCVSDLAVFNECGDEQYSKTYTYEENKVASIEELYYDEEANETAGNTYSYLYRSSYTSVSVTVYKDDSETDTETVTTTYVFDDGGNVISEYAEINDEKYETSTNCQPINPCSDNALNVIISNENLISNHTFTHFLTDENGNQVLDGWSKDVLGESVSISLVYDDDSKAMYGRKSLFITSKDTENNASGYIQSVTLNKGNYVFSAYAKILNEFVVDGIMSEDTPGIFLQALINGNDFTDASEFVNERTSGFVHMSISFTVPNDSTTVDLALLCNGKGSAYVSCPMLEKGNSVGEYNLLETNSLDNWELGEDSAEIDYTDSEGFKTNGSIMLYQTSSVKQTVYPKKSASILESYVLSAWVKAVQHFETDAIYTTSLKAVINYSNGDTEVFTHEFYPAFDVWQKCELHFEKSKCLPVESIDVFCDYTGTLYTTYLDNVELCREDIVTGFSGESIGEDAYTSTDADTSTSVGDFDEVVDEKGNLLTSTTFSDGCFGAFYRSYAYSENGNDKITETDTRGNSTNYEVDTLTSRITSICDRLGNTTKYEYRKDGKVSKVTHIDSNENVCSTVEYSYDYNGNVASILRGDGKAYNFAYGNTGLLVNALDGTVTYNYRVNSGRLKSMTYANGSTVNLTYDSLGRLTHEIWTKDNVVEADYRYAYDREGNVISSVDKLACKEYNYYYKDGNVIRTSVNAIEYDGEEIISRESVSSIRYTYDENGQIKKKEYTSIGLKVYYRYGDNTDTVAKYLYGNSVAEYHSETDHLGRRTVDEVRTDKYVHYRKFEYEEGKITPTHANDNKAISHPETNLVSRIIYPDRALSYGYDAEERIVTHKDYQGYTNEYTYDAQGQLICHVIKQSASDETDKALSVTYYEYDSYGNILAKGSVLATDGKLDRTSASNCVYTYDTVDHDKLVSYSNGTNTFNMVYDSVGNPTSYKASALIWGKGRQLKKYGKHYFEYNADGIRTARYFNTTVDGNTVQVRYDYELEGTKLVRMLYRDKNGVTNELIPLYDTADSPIGIICNGTRYWYIKSLQGDILALRNDNGADIVRYRYDAWGKATVLRDNSGCDLADINPFRYRGYLYDYEFGLYYLQSRYYDPETCRFINPDDIEIIGFGQLPLEYNLYSYCINDPINNTDIMGFISFKTIISKIKDVIGMILKHISKYITNLFYIDKSNRIITISSSAIAIAIDALIVMMVNAILYRSIKNVIKLIIKSQKIRNSFIELMLQFLLEKKLGRLILHVLFSKALHLANKPTALATMREGLISDYISNIITQKHIILQKSNSLISAFSSIGGIIAFLLDLSDSNWDDSLVIQY